MFFRKRIFGVVMISFGFGMFIGILLSAWWIVLAAVAVIIGFWNLLC